MQAAIQTRDSVVQNWRIRFILASVLLFPALTAAEDPPANLVRLIAARETETAQAQSNYRGLTAKYATLSFRLPPSAANKWSANRIQR
jgi:hypothetical protein